MQSISENITEVFYHLLSGEAGDANEGMNKSKGERWPALLWAYLTTIFRN